MSGTSGVVSDGECWHDTSHRYRRVSPEITIRDDGYRIEAQLSSKPGEWLVWCEYKYCDIQLPEIAVRPMRELLSLRATVNNVSGAPHPHVRLESRMEDKPFSLRINRDFAKRLGKVMLAEIELQAKVQRNADGHIESGRMIEFEPVSSRDETVTAWTEWYKANASEWDKVEDIEGEAEEGG